MVLSVNNSSNSGNVQRPILASNLADRIAQVKERQLHLMNFNAFAGSPVYGVHGENRTFQQNVAREILTTEVTYNNTLQALTLILESLKNESQMEEFLKTCPRNERKKCKKFLRELSELVPKLKKVSDTLVLNLSKATTVAEVGSSFMKALKNAFEIQSVFYEKYTVLVKTQFSERSTQAFNNLIEKLKKDSVLPDNTLNFSSLTITPVQRFPRYELLLKEFNKANEETEKNKGNKREHQRIEYVSEVIQSIAKGTLQAEDNSIAAARAKVKPLLQRPGFGRLMGM